MTHGNEQADEPTLFSAVLTPHRSLSASGFLVVMAAIGGLSFTAGVTFLILGAWPVFGFFGLDVLLVYLAFRINYRTATALEEISVTASELRVRKVTHRGQVTDWTLNPVWVRLDRETHEEFGLQRLFLVSLGRRFPIATFLSPGEKASFATALAAAISAAKRGPTRSEM
jgi:uncharacterized membrane protein